MRKVLSASRISLYLSGLTSLSNPSALADLWRLSAWLTLRNSPESPTSPNIAMLLGIGIFRREEAIAVRTARSAAGSLSLMPPTTLTKMSWFWRFSFPCFSRTAAKSWRRFRSKPLEVRLG